jgi:basic amino acid/polyamine antiporter, APA family
MDKNDSAESKRTQEDKGQTGKKSQLRRDLQLISAVAIGLGAIIGAGIFVVTGVAAGVAGPSFLIGLILAGIVATFNALSSAQLAASYPQSGGTYEYGYRVLHPWLGFAAGWMFLASKLAAGGTVALGFAGYLASLFPVIPERPAAVTAVVVLTVVNYFGIRKSGNLNLLIVSISIFALGYFIVAGIPSFDSANLQPFAPQGLTGTLQSAALLFFAYTGYARLATLGEEVSEPRTTIPRAIALALGIAIVLYMLVAFVAVGGVGSEALAASPSPLETAAQAFQLPGARVVVAVGATTAMLGVLLSQLLGISRMMFAMARRGDLPAVLDHVHPVNEIPDRGVVLAGIILVLVAVFGTLEVIVAAASFTILLYYSIANIAAYRMPREGKLFPDWIPVLGLITCLILAFTLSPWIIGSGLGLLGVGFVWRWVYRKVSQRPSQSAS